MTKMRRLFSNAAAELGRALYFLAYYLHPYAPREVIVKEKPVCDHMQEHASCDELPSLQQPSLSYPEALSPPQPTNGGYRGIGPSESPLPAPHTKQAPPRGTDLDSTDG